MTDRSLALVAFVNAQNCSNYIGSWRHPAAMPDYGEAEYYARVARTLEHGCFDLAFLDDRLAMPDRYRSDYADSVRHGIRTIKLDLIPCVTAMALATTRLGIGATYSTTYYQPYHVARLFATMDLMFGGRVAWNIVTSVNDAEAANFGYDESLPHDLRYDRAEEFVRTVLGHWDTWEDGAIVRDQASGIFADPAKVHRLAHEGNWFRSRGPLTVPRSRQGRPVLMQAGQSGRGREFAARWAELVFVIYPHFDAARRAYREFKAQVAGVGRDPDKVKVLPAVFVVAGETQSVAEDRKAVMEKLSKPIDGLVLLSELLNFDLGAKAADEPLTDDELQSISGQQGLRDRVIALSGKKNPTVRDFVEYSARGTIHEFPLFCGSPAQIADEMEKWLVSEACDGFVVSAPLVPGSFEDVVRLVVPELQRRGLFRKEYGGSTLRESLGLPRAATGDWMR
jgi:FMN-dependent oxidoreductase (nitrilotriacetate monooxygenase family)